MDAIELARQAAAQLHEQAVVNGHDPWKPYAFARVETERRGLDVEVTASGAANLEDACMSTSSSLSPSLSWSVSRIESRQVSGFGYP
jgi:hypothetical protein